LVNRSALRYFSPHWQLSVRRIRAWLMDFARVDSLT
jgi:hypothetical protein